MLLTSGDSDNDIVPYSLMWRLCDYYSMENFPNRGIGIDYRLIFLTEVKNQASISYTPTIIQAYSNHNPTIIFSQISSFAFLYLEIIPYVFIRFSSPTSPISRPS